MLRARPTEEDVALPPCALFTGDKGSAGRAFRALFRGALITMDGRYSPFRARLFASIGPMGCSSHHVQQALGSQKFNCLAVIAVR
jgi:hypothetical protein